MRSVTLRKSVSFEYISICETLRKLISKPEVYEVIQTEREYENSLYILNHDFFCKNENLRLIFYNDELELLNPLGDAAGIYKLSMFYFTLSNLTQKHNSELKNIFLVAIAFSDDLKTYGWDSLFDKFMNEILKELL